MIKNVSGVLIAVGLFGLSFTLLPKKEKTVVTDQNKSGLESSMVRGKKVYAEQCLVCHQAGGTGVQNMHPPLIKTKWVLGDKTALVQIVLKGLTGEIEVNENTYHNVMAPHSELSDQQIADVLTYVRNSFGNKAKAITPAEVKAIRAKTK